MEVSIIIVNYNVKFFLEQCLYSVLNAVKNIEAEIIVFDNNSTDGSDIYLKDKFETVQFIWNENNEGFSRANNMARQKATGRFILFLNPDTIIAEDCIEKCLSFYESTANAGAIGIKMIDGTGQYLKESKRGFPTPFTALFKFCGLSEIFPTSKIFANYYLGHLSPDKNHPAPILSGAFMMVSKDVLDKTQGFDESFFMYGEDIDLSYRIQKIGFINYYLAESAIIHFKGESTKKDNQHYVKLFYGAMHLFLNKHYGWIEAGFYSLFIHTAIKIKAVLNSFKKIFVSTNNTGDQLTLMPIATIIIGNQTDYDSICELAKTAAISLNIAGRVSPTNVVANNCLGTLQQLALIIKKFSVEKIIFCINELSAKEIIEIVQQISPPIGYCFHASGSSSTVGSSTKFGVTECVTVI